VPAIARVVSVNIGQPQPRHRLLGDGTTSQHYLTAIVKQPVHGPVSVQPLGLEGDAHGDTVGHGGADKAVHFQFRQHLDWLAQIIHGALRAGGEEVPEVLCWMAGG
jgi:MOSC domain-containing protein YiiM